MPRGQVADRDAVIAFVKQYHADNGERPTQAFVAASFGISPATAGNIIRTVDDMPGEPRRAGRQAVIEVSDASVYEFVRRFTLEHGWAPSQREIAIELGCAPHKANFYLHRLVQQGLIELGSDARQVRIVGTKMEIPEVTM